MTDNKILSIKLNTDINHASAGDLVDSTVTSRDNNGMVIEVNHLWINTLLIKNSKQVLKKFFIKWINTSQICNSK